MTFIPESFQYPHVFYARECWVKVGDGWHRSEGESTPTINQQLTAFVNEKKVKLTMISPPSVYPVTETEDLRIHLCGVSILYVPPVEEETDPDREE